MGGDSKNFGEDSFPMRCCCTNTTTHTHTQYTRASCHAPPQTNPTLPVEGKSHMQRVCGHAFCCSGVHQQMC